MKNISLKIKINMTTVSLEFNVDKKKPLKDLKRSMLQVAILMGYSLSEFEDEFGSIELYEQDKAQLSLFDNKPQLLKG